MMNGVLYIHGGLKTFDGTGRKNVSDKSYWEDVINKTKSNDLELFIAGFECFAETQSYDDPVGYRGKEFNILKNGEMRKVRIYHVGTIPINYRDVLKSNCEFY